MARPFPLIAVADLPHWSSRRWELSGPAGYGASSWHESGAGALAAICTEVASARGHQVTVALPAYFCGQSLRFLRGVGVRFVFYALNNALLPDLEDTRRRLAHARPDVLLHVHYFGRIAGQAESRALADDLGAILVEDAAHVMAPEACANWIGDHVVFSPHKHFPLPSIGLVLSRFPLALGGRTRQSVSGLGRWFLRQVGARAVRPRGGEWGIVWSAQTAYGEVGTAPRDRVVRAASGALTGFAEAARQRGRNAEALQQILAGVEGWTPVQRFAEGDVPYMIGLQCDTVDIARRRFEALRHPEALVMQWPDLPEEVRGVEQITAWCTERVERTLFFFVHQRLKVDNWTRALCHAIGSETF